jgi:N-methylhydantoinase A/oxoprolinase/acetone carboxylase beta subunit
MGSFGGEREIPVASRQRVHVIACGVLSTDLDRVAAPADIELSREYLPPGLHRSPRALRRRLQEAVDRASDGGGVDRIAIGYGLCGHGTVGIRARGVPLSLPRVQDCIALFLGSDAAYREQFDEYPGTYYVSAGWVESNSHPLSAEEVEPADRDSVEVDYRRLEERYGRDNADAVRYFLNSWQRNYQRAVFIDTGVGERRAHYEEIARNMAGAFGWRYERLRGTDALLRKLVAAGESDADILLVPPGQVTVLDAAGRRLMASTLHDAEEGYTDQPVTLVFEGAPARDADRLVRLGLGIDAGGTYTDAVIYDFERERVVGKSKAPTTPWDFTVGIGRALRGLDAASLSGVGLVSVSTTLATNAIVEGRGQKVGLLIMPPYGLYEPSDIPHRPLAVLRGKMEITGVEIESIDPEQVRRLVREMIQKEQVGAFAAVGYASHVNPAHEHQVRDLVVAECGMSVTCGQDVSEAPNYRIRATTAALNARIIPCLESLLDEVRVSLNGLGIRAPVMVVKSDGSLFNVRAARDRPVETILSGPAASAAGAGFLSGVTDAVAVDIGGTTTDTAIIRGGAVQTCDRGASVGRYRTHVRALDMRTIGLGGDSLVAFVDGALRIGPRRVVPLSYMARDTGDNPHRAGLPEALEWVASRLDRFATSTSGMEIAALTGREPDEIRFAGEARVIEELRERPRSLSELTERTGNISVKHLPLLRLEERHLIERGGLTPTDLLHADGTVALWNAEIARRILALHARLRGVPPERLAADVLRRCVDLLTVELLKRELAGHADPDEIDSSPVSRILIENMLGGGSEGFQVQVRLRRPVIGIGAPVAAFLPDAADRLQTDAVIPPHADVANAVGAIISSVSVQKKLQITPDDRGLYRVHGLADAPGFVEFDEAYGFALETLQEIVRARARDAGTGETRVEVTVRDSTGQVADGSRIFLGRTLHARLFGRPDLARISA